MMFWDSSAVLPILISEAASTDIANLFRGDTAMMVWWGTEVECVSALSRRERETPSAAAAMEEAFGRLDYLKHCWHEIQPKPAVRATARRLLRTHPLRAADALQLAASIIASEENPENLPFVCLDDRLIIAAKKEGFQVLPA